MSELTEEYAHLLLVEVSPSFVEVSPSFEDFIDRARMEPYWRAVNRIPEDARSVGVGTTTPASGAPDGYFWFYFAAPQSRSFAFQARSSDASLDPVIAVYSAADDGLEFLEFNDDRQEGSLDAGLSVVLEQGGGYYVVVSDLHGRPGSLSLSVE